MSKKRSKKVVILLILALCLMNISTAFATTTSKVTTNSKSIHAWTGLHAYTIGVKGYYDVENGKITSYNTVRATTSTSGPWSSSDRFAEWASSGSTYGKAYGEAFFILGVTTTWINLGFQSRTDSITSSARP